MADSPVAKVDSLSSTGASDVTYLNNACRKNAKRFVGILCAAYVVNQLDRNNIAYAGLTMNADLGLTASQFGWAAGLTIFAYSLFEVPSNLFMQRIGARLWLARIMITWGIVGSATAFVVGPYSLYAMRLLLGVAEAGFFPGVVLYLSIWFPVHFRTRVLAWFLLAIPASSLIGGPMAGALLAIDGYLNLAGWQWLFLVEGAPAVLLGILTFKMLVDLPKDASWLTCPEKNALVTALSNERRLRPHHNFVAALKDVRVFVLTAIQFGFTLGSYGISIWLPLILQGHGLSNMQVAFISAPPFLAAGIGMLVWARLVDRRGGHIFHLSLSCVVAVLGLGCSVVFSGLIASLTALTVALVGITSARTIFWTVPPRFLVGNAAAGGIALINSIGMLGGFFGPYLMGSLKDLTGSFSAGLLMMAGIVAVSAVLAASLRLLFDGDDDEAKIDLRK